MTDPTLRNIDWNDSVVPRHMAEDVVLALSQLAQRSGAHGIEIGFVRNNVPIEDAGWYASVMFQGARIMAQEHRSPSTAALALAERLLSVSICCRCDKPVSLNAKHPGCRWRLIGPRWMSECEAPPITVLTVSLPADDDDHERREAG